jgi:DNA-binding XRE family transcriptional regulator
MKVQITDEFADISLRVPTVFVDQITGILKNALALIDEKSKDEFAEDRSYSVEEVFPEGITPGDVLQGMRYREDLTQAKLAEMVGVKPSHISDMENGRRPIGKEMAKRLGKALNAGYKVFL